MDIGTIAKQVDAETARAFVSAARHVIDALLIEGERVQQMHAPVPRDYGAASLSRERPAGGWLAHGELRQTVQKMAEAIAAEKWTEGMVLAIRLLGGMAA
ncbi:MAG: hypothetical protein KKB50_04270 [Planctomycetes bacterium]|nr:hypothetical protein [Planctomycetota bacterium]